MDPKPTSPESQPKSTIPRLKGPQGSTSKKQEQVDDPWMNLSKVEPEKPLYSTNLTGDSMGFTNTKTNDGIGSLGDWNFGGK